MAFEQSDLYEISMSEYEKLKWYPVSVKRGKKTFNFEVYESCCVISVFYIDELCRKRAIVSMEELEMMLVIEEDKRKFRNFIGDIEWVLLDGVCADRGMKKEEVAAYLYLKSNVLDEMESKLDVRV
ncbi:hypothetical protein P4J13_25440 [Bacillus anthracis]|uniref:hypothetical protein n=1 Tax=Bacillus anthracis TaxID=1392 RepID=UPI002DB8E147|nr:hypothetical protein [Bacillus anthracis]MEB9507278.1 hypothetical protein [Bacillus anthracis]